LADHFKKEAIFVENSDDDASGIDAASWILVTENKQFLITPEVEENVTLWPEDMKTIFWTDNFSDLYSVLHKKPKESLIELYEETVDKVKNLVSKPKTEDDEEE
jgi:hypothetical protein